MVVCLERGADLHMAQLMSLPLAVSCFSTIQICFTLLAPAHPGSPGVLDKGPLNGCVYIVYTVQYVASRIDKLKLAVREVFLTYNIGGRSGMGPF